MKLSVAALLLLSVPAVLSAPISLDESLYTKTPAGMVLAQCVHKVASGSNLVEQPNGDTLVTHDHKPSWTIPKCDGKGLPVALPAKTAPSQRKLNQLPADYDGWTAYTAFQDKAADQKGFDSFLGYFSVPDIPDATPQVLYIFTGLQNIDWIPKADPWPTADFDIIQPVLQYLGDNGNYWSIKSWYVTVNAGAVYSDEIEVQTGDNIFGNMTRVGPTAWFINSVSSLQKTETKISVDHPRLKTQPWAYNTIECYGCDGCSTYPLNSTYFTQLGLWKGKTSVSPLWLINPKPQTLQCKELPIVHGPDNVEFRFQ